MPFTSTARFELPVATAASTVQVSAEAGATIDTTTTQLESSFESEELRSLPYSFNPLQTAFLTSHCSSLASLLAAVLA